MTLVLYGSNHSKHLVWYEKCGYAITRLGGKTLLIGSVADIETPALWSNWRFSTRPTTASYPPPPPLPPPNSPAPPLSFLPLRILTFTISDSLGSEHELEQAQQAFANHLKGNSGRRQAEQAVTHACGRQVCDSTDILLIDDGMITMAVMTLMMMMKCGGNDDDEVRWRWWWWSVVEMMTRM